MNFMPWSRAARSISLKMAICAILVGSLAPAITHLLRLGGPSGWTEICSALGVRFVPSDSADPGTEQPNRRTPQHLLEHCPYCTLHAATLGLPPLPLAVPALTLPRFGVPELFLAAPRTLFAWMASLPRGPPRPFS
jgi:hypothetical protein